MSVIGPAVLAGCWLGVPGGQRVDLRPTAAFVCGPGSPGSSGAVKSDGPVTLARLAAAVAQLEQSHVYVVDAAQLQLEAHDGWEVLETGEGVDGKPWRLRCRREADDRVVWVCLIERDQSRVGGPWAGLGAAELLRAFANWHRLTGVSWEESAGRTGETLLLATHPTNKGGTRLQPAGVLPEVLRGNALEMPYSRWRRPLVDDERGATYVHVFDANALYLAAWQTTELGVGGPVHQQHPKFDQKQVGFWRIPSLAKLANPFPRLPTPFLEGREWYTTRTVRETLEWCVGLDLPPNMIEEAWVWPRSSRWLQTAGERLRDVRADAMRVTHDAKAALAGATRDVDARAALDRQVVAGTLVEAVKGVYTVTTQRFGAEMDRQREDGSWSPWYRPDWGHLVRATARCNLHRRLRMHMTTAPFAIEVDALMFASSNPHPGPFAESIGIQLGEGLREWKHVATVATTDPQHLTFSAVRKAIAAGEAVVL